VRQVTHLTIPSLVLFLAWYDREELLNPFLLADADDLAVSPPLNRNAEAAGTFRGDKATVASIQEISVVGRQPLEDRPIYIG
jgi:hypothetical protein